MENVRTEPGILPTFLDLLIHPEEAVRELVRTRHRGFSAFALGAFIFTIFLPILWYFARFDFLQTRVSSILGLAAIILCTLVLFVLITPPFLALFRCEYTRMDILTAFLYGSCPLTVLILLYYLLDLLLFGRLTGVVYVITGVRDAHDWTLRYLPYIHLLGKILFINVYARALRHIGSHSMSYGLMVALISSIPFYVSVFLCYSTLIVVDPYAANAIKRLIESALSLFG